MTVFQILAWIILTAICFIFAPLMTIGIIFIGAGWIIAGYIFVMLGIIHMIIRWLR